MTDRRERSINTLTLVSEAKPRVEALKSALAEVQAKSPEATHVEITVTDLVLLLALAEAALEGYKRAAARSLRI